MTTTSVKLGPPPPHKCNYVVNHVVFTHTAGIFRGLYISPEISPYVTEILHDKETCSILRAAVNATDRLAMVYLEFPARDLQLKFTADIEEHIYPVMEEQS